MEQTQFEERSCQKFHFSMRILKLERLTEIELDLLTFIIF